MLLLYDKLFRIMKEIPGDFCSPPQRETFHSQANKTSGHKQKIKSTFIEPLKISVLIYLSTLFSLRLCVGNLILKIMFLNINEREGVKEGGKSSNLNILNQFRGT